VVAQEQIRVKAYMGVQLPQGGGDGEEGDAGRAPEPLFFQRFLPIFHVCPFMTAKFES
jgi:hypothetical protein